MLDSRVGTDRDRVRPKSVLLRAEGNDLRRTGRLAACVEVRGLLRDRGDSRTVCSRARRLARRRDARGAHVCISLCRRGHVVRASPTPLYPHAAGCDPRLGYERATAHAGGWRSGQPARPSAWLRYPTALPAGKCALPQGAARIEGGSARGPGGVPRGRRGPRSCLKHLDIPARRSPHTVSIVLIKFACAPQCSP